jgi:hypothetical protein
MGKFRSDGTDRVKAIATGTFTAAEAGAWIDISGSFNLWIWGSAGRIYLEASFDAGDTAIAELDDGGAPLALTVPQRIIVDELEQGILYRLVCDEIAEGDEIHWRASK